MIIFDEKRAGKDLIAEGGEGRIYTFSKTQLLKIFKEDVDKEEKLRKIEKIMNLSLPASVVKPLDLVFDTPFAKPNPNVYDYAHNFVGYSMHKVKGEELHILSSRKFVKSNNVTKKEILQMLLEIATTLDVLHKQDIYIGDLSDSNILFDDNYNVYFIDVDSWSVGPYHCNVANEAFKDPNLIHNNFNAQTDLFAFAIIAYKCLTRLHPFGGVYKNMGLEERIKHHITAVRNKDVCVPKMVDQDVFMPKDLINMLEAIFSTNTRVPINSELNNFYNHLKYCAKHEDYFYAQFNKCPVCEMGAAEVAPITNIGVITSGQIPIREIFSGSAVKILFTELVYLTTANEIRFRNSGYVVPFEKGAYYYINDKGDSYYMINKEIIDIITPLRTFTINKKYNSFVMVQNNSVYYISENLVLTRFGVVDNEMSFTEDIETVSINNVFNIQDLHTYFICNNYDTRKIISVCGYHHELDNKDKIVNSAIHYDEVSQNWLFIYETTGNKFVTMILNKKKGILAQRDDLHYMGPLTNLCFQNELIYKPSDGAIIRFNYKTNEYKEFKVPVISVETKLLKRQNKFIVINEDKIFEIG
jgi:serine/threonine protein kinase